MALVHSSTPPVAQTIAQDIAPIYYVLINFFDNFFQMDIVNSKLLGGLLEFISDSMIPNGQRNTLAEYMILSGADNRPPMLDKDLYDSWKSRMELYIQNREHERMILESVEHGPLIWPTIEENGVIRTKKYAELVAKDLWERDQLLMQGTSLTKQERECKLLPLEWSKFVTDVKLVKDLHTTNFDQLHAYLQQHKLHANEVRIMSECNPDPLALSLNDGSIHPPQHYSSTYPSQHQFNYSSIPSSHPYQSQMNHQSLRFLNLLINPLKLSTQTMTKLPFVTQPCVPVCLQEITYTLVSNKAMAFLAVVASSRFPSTNNQLRT
ncbi:hypothetical protein Tco_0669168 [Tanacetum coccineum]